MQCHHSQTKTNKQTNKQKPQNKTKQNKTKKQTKNKQTNKQKNKNPVFSRLELQMFYYCNSWIAGNSFQPMVLKLCISGLFIPFVWRLDYQRLGSGGSRHVAQALVLLHGDLHFWKPCFVSNPWQPSFTSVTC